ncbi:hypothetical protein Acr_03g0011760 [Actinidia rufa]|uniref:F-box domain-containing protein n=1 Tax=Actinidia rufa TaxID=165716 RepID=A0A7J0EDH5_9ERIC|nr:hypothetical protein Acr_03g0011760 [Actinidia rufa]
MSEHSSSADKVAANNDLVTEILRRLPVKSLVQFKSVSKHWLSLITTPYFARCLIPDPSSVSGLFLYSSMRCLNPELIFIPLQNDKYRADNANSTTLPGTLSISFLSSCYGFFCCSSYCHTTDRQFHVFNPTTMQFDSLPKLQDGLKGLSLAFDLSRSPHYKVVCVRLRYTHPRPAPGDPFTADLNTQFLGGVYWNNAINWFNSSGDSLYFNVEDERLGVMPMPPIPPGEWSGRPFSRTCISRYVAEALVGFDVLLLCYTFSHSGEKDKSFLVLHVPGKILRYNLADKSFKELYDVAPEHCDSNGMIEDSISLKII